MNEIIHTFRYQSEADADCCYTCLEVSIVEEGFDIRLSHMNADIQESAEWIATMPREDVAALAKWLTQYAV